ncbi:helix-turn-helix transcriptional regulator [Yeosuana marina]|uniref:helix-turn-helix domain-containing protein n=1 Tax=Yeosuana marina TaxID=1565536 RepID=UPI0030C88E96
MFNLTRILCVSLCVFVYSIRLSAVTQSNVVSSKEVSAKFETSINQINHFINTQKGYKEQEFQNLLESNNLVLKQNPDSTEVLKKLAIINAELGKSKPAFEYTNKYIKNSLDFSILANDSFDNIKDSNEYKLLISKYLVKIDFFTFLYCYFALIGLFLVVILNLNKRTDKITNILISSFVLIHVLFVLEYVLYQTNIQFIYPHTYLLSTSMALMYGPLLFLYFKREVKKNVFKKRDLLHFLPSILLLIFILRPIYLLEASEKIKMMLGISNVYPNYGLYIFLLKLISLIVYGIFIWKIYFNNVRNANKNKDFKTNIIWQKNIYRIHVVYVISYLIYGISISGILGESASIIYNSHVASMSAMIIYVAYMAYAQPKLFIKESESFKSLYNKEESIKYEKSGMTDSLSKELSNSLISLLVEKKVYKDSAISLESLSNQLGTTRHNTSQIINEHFNMNYFELINRFRIDEAIDILKSDIFGNLNIIDVAYEVGFNNKVTFNKAFKKQTSLTPSEFIALNLKTSTVIN